MKEKKSSYNDILKSTGIIGGSKFITIIIRIVRTKIVAVLLGPTGIGLVGLYQSIISLVSRATNLGLGTSAVKDIAEANSTKDNLKISKTIYVLRRWVWFTGILGMLLTLIFSKALSRYTFGDESKAWSIAILSIVVLLTAISGGQLALLQGLRKISKLAKASIWGAILSFFVAVPLYYFFGNKGIIPVLIISAIITLTLSWLYSRSVKTETLKISLKETYYSGMGMVKLGLSMAITGLLSTATMYGVKIFISNKLNVEAVGFFQAAWAISTIYLGMILEAMGTDYFPRLSAVNKDNKALNKLVNEQTEVGLLISFPLLIGMISFLPLVISILYSSRFSGAIPMMQWMLPGMFLRIILWPMGFVIVSKGMGKLFIGTQTFWNIVFLGLLVVSWKWFELEAVGFAFVIAYFFSIILNFLLLHRITNFKWENKSLRLIIPFLLVIIIAFIASRYLKTPFNYLAGGILTIMVTIFSLFQLNKIYNIGKLFKKLLISLRKPK